MDNWPALIIRARDNISAQVPLELRSSQSGHAACFRVLSEYTRNLNNMPVLHNFAAAVFHLSLALKVFFFFIPYSCFNSQHRSGKPYNHERASGQTIQVGRLSDMDKRIMLIHL
jgi:hypothetical protein